MVMWCAVPCRRITSVLSPAPVSSVMAWGDSVSSMNRQRAGLMPKVARPPCTIGGLATISSSGITTGRARRPGCVGEPGRHCLVECDNSPRNLPRPERGEALVDLFEPVRTAHQLVDLQSALHVEID